VTPGPPEFSAASASDVQQALAFVRLARESAAARGPVFGSEYLIEPRR
jgi:hypothetical protein